MRSNDPKLEPMINVQMHSNKEDNQKMKNHEEESKGEEKANVTLIDTIRGKLAKHLHFNKISLTEDDFQDLAGEVVLKCLENSKYLEQYIERQLNTCLKQYLSGEERKRATQTQVAGEFEWFGKFMGEQDRRTIEEVAESLTDRFLKQFPWLGDNKGRQRLTFVFKVLLEDMYNNGVKIRGEEIMKRKFEKDLELIGLAVLYDSFCRHHKITFALEFYLLFGSKALAQMIEVFGDRVGFVPSEKCFNRWIRDFRIWRYITGSNGRERSNRISAVAGAYDLSTDMVRKIFKRVDDFVWDMGNQAAIIMKSELDNIEN